MMPYHIVCLAGKKSKLKIMVYDGFFYFSGSQVISTAFHPQQLRTCISTSEESLQYINSKVGNFLKMKILQYPRIRALPYNSSLYFDTSDF